MPEHIGYIVSTACFFSAGALVLLITIGVL